MTLLAVALGALLIAVIVAALALDLSADASGPPVLDFELDDALLVTVEPGTANAASAASSTPRTHTTLGGGVSDPETIQLGDRTARRHPRPLHQLSRVLRRQGQGGHPMTLLAVALGALLIAVIVAALARFDRDQQRIVELEVENRRMRRQIERCERSVGGRIRAAHREHVRHWEVA